MIRVGLGVGGEMLLSRQMIGRLVHQDLSRNGRAQSFRSHSSSLRSIIFACLFLLGSSSSLPPPSLPPPSFSSSDFFLNVFYYLGLVPCLFSFPPLLLHLSCASYLVFPLSYFPFIVVYLLYTISFLLRPLGSFIWFIIT